MTFLKELNIKWISSEKDLWILGVGKYIRLTGRMFADLEILGGFSFSKSCAYEHKFAR